MSALRRFEVSSITRAAGGGLVITNSTAYSLDAERAEWKGRPWLTRAIWSSRFQRWEARVNPGFVNGEDAVARGYDPLDAQEGEVRDLGLMDAPSLPILSTRDVVGSGGVIPKYFQVRGVRREDLGIEISAGGGVQIDTTPEAENPLPLRGLRAVDFWIAVARATYEVDVTVVDPSGFSGQIVDYSVRWNTSQIALRGARARLLWGPEFRPVRPISIEDRLMGNYTDEGEDRILIATIYFLSPPEQGDSLLDSRWQSFVKHHCFWNLSHAARNRPPENMPRPIRFFSGLAAGFGDVLINQNLSLTNDLADRIVTAVRNTDNAGSFWSV